MSSLDQAQLASYERAVWTDRHTHGGRVACRPHGGARLGSGVRPSPATGQEGPSEL